MDIMMEACACHKVAWIRYFAVLAILYFRHGASNDAHDIAYLMYSTLADRAYTSNWTRNSKTWELWTYTGRTHESKVYTMPTSDGTSPSLIRTGTANALENQATTYPVTCPGKYDVWIGWSKWPLSTSMLNCAIRLGREGPGSCFTTTGLLSVKLCQFQMDESLSDTYGYSECSGKPSYNVSCDMSGSWKRHEYTH